MDQIWQYLVVVLLVIIQHKALERQLNILGLLSFQM